MPVLLFDPVSGAVCLCLSAGGDSLTWGGEWVAVLKTYVSDVRCRLLLEVAEEPDVYGCQLLLVGFCKELLFP